MSYRDTYKDPYALGYKNGYYPNVSGASSATINSIDALAAAADPGQELADIMGVVKPTLMYYGGDASGALELIAGSANLSDGGTPGKQQTDHAFSGDTLTTEILTTTTDQMIAAANTVADVADVPLIILYAGQLVATNATLGLFGKRDGTAPNIGYEFNHNNGGFLSWATDHASGAVARTVSIDHGTTAPFSALMTRLITANEQNLYTNKGDATGGRHAETLTNTQTLSIGKGRTSGCLHHCALLAFWIDEGEAGFDADALAAFNTAMGIS